jgi:hypothetical protein
VLCVDLQTGYGVAVAITLMRWTTWIPWVNTGEEAKVQPQPQDVHAGTPWPMPPQSIVRAWHDDDYVIDVELRLGEHDTPVVTGISVRRAVPMERRRDFKREPSWPDDAVPRSVSPRDVQRLPLSTVVRAALLWTQATKDDPESRERAGKMGRVDRILARSRGKKGPRGDEFYRTLGLAHYEFVRAGVQSPVKELATQMGEPPGNIHVWLHRARKRGFRTGHTKAALAESNDCPPPSAR